MQYPLFMEYAGVMGRIRSSAVRNDDELLWKVALCTVLVSTRLDIIERWLFLKSEPYTVNVWSGGPAEASGEATIYRDRSTVK